MKKLIPAVFLLLYPVIFLTQYHRRKHPVVTRDMCQKHMAPKIIQELIIVPFPGMALSFMAKERLTAKDSICMR